MAFAGEPVSTSPGHAYPSAHRPLSANRFPLRRAVRGIANSFTATVNRNATPVY